MSFAFKFLWGIGTLFWVVVVITAAGMYTQEHGADGTTTTALIIMALGPPLAVYWVGSRIGAALSRRKS